MIRMILFTLVMSTAMVSCNGQVKINDKQLSDNQPQKNIVVNKEYDENGNLIKYDSTYSYYYSNIGTDEMKRDSIFKNFEDQFNQSYLFSRQPYFNDFFFKDSLLMFDFYKKDFFYDRFRNNMDRMDSLFKEMDKLKNDFFNEQTIPIIK